MASPFVYVSVNVCMKLLLCPYVVRQKPIAIKHLHVNKVKGHIKVI